MYRISFKKSAQKELLAIATMKKLINKKSFLEIYIPIGLVVGAFTAACTGLSLFVSMVIGVFIALIGYAIYLKKNATAQ